MKKLLTFLMFFLLATAMAQMQAATTTTYTFSSKSWEATPANWTGSKDGNQYSASSSPIGVQIVAAGNGTTVTSPKSFTNVSKVVVNYSSSGKGVGSIGVSVGDTNIGSQSIEKSKSKVDLTYTPTAPLSGNVVITCNCTTSSYALVSVSITEDGGVTPPTPTTYSVTVADNITGGTVTASPTSAKEGDDVTLTATPASGYEFGSWNVTNASTSATITVTNNKFKMPAANVNVSATFNEVTPGPTPTGTTATFIFNTDAGLAALGITKPAASQGTNLGTSAYTSNGISMTATNGGTETRVWNSNGTTSLRVYKNGGSLTFSGVTVGTKIKKVEFTGSSLNSFSLASDNGTYSDGTWTGEAENVMFNATGSVTINTITVTYENGTTPPTPEKELIAIGVTGTPAEFWKGDAFNHNGITVTALWDDGDETDVTSFAEFSTPDMTTAGEKTVTVTYQGETATYTINVQTIANTEATAYTVAEAKALIDAGKDLETEVYVKGTVSKVDSYNDTYKSITYWIDNNEFEVYSGKGLNGADFASVNDITVGDDVVVKGIIKKYQSTYEFDKNNVLVKHVKVATLSIADITVANGEDINPVVNTNVTGEYLIEYVSNNEKVVLADDNELVTMGVGEATITATLVADGYKTAETTFKVTVTNNVTVTGITLGGTPKLDYTYGEAFDRTGITATANYSDDSQVDVTSTATWTVAPSTALTESGEVTVTAAFGGQTASQTYNVTVNKKPASVAIENVEVEVGKMATISATTTPADAALTYTVTEGTDKISIADGVITGVAEGTATVKATFAGNDEFNAAEATFTVNVTPPSVVTTLSKDGDIAFVTGSSSATGAFWANSTPLTANGLTLSGSNNSSSSYSYFDGSVVRFYQNNSFTITPDDGVTITKIEIIRQATTGSNSGVINCEVLTASENNTTTNTNVYTGPTTSAVTFTAAAQARFTAVKVYTEPTAPVGTLDHIAVVEGYKADYTEGETFEKATVMAYYQEEGVEPVNVTNKATFSGYDLSAETSGEQTVNVSYTEGEVTATASYTINFTAVTKRTVTIVEPVNGQLKVVVKATGAEIATGARVADGTVLKITNTPDEGYVLRKIVVTDTEKHNYTAQDKEITVNGIDVTINAIFIKGDNYTYTWSVNGQVASQDVYEAGATVTAPAVTAGQCPAGKTFVGWSRTATVDADNCTLATVDPTAVTDRTYFAVFAKATTTGGGGETYYEKITPGTYDYGYWSDPNKQYILVYENGSNANVFNGIGQKEGTNYVETTINTSVTPYRIESFTNNPAIITMTEWNTNGYKFHVNGSETVIMHTDDSQLNVGVPDEQKVSITEQKFQISCENGSWVVSSLNTWLRFDSRSGNLNFKAADSKTKWNDIQFYVKKNAGTTTYSEYTTGMTVNPRDFQLVTDLEKDLKPGREYIIVSKFINDDNSRTIYGLSVDNADSRTENGKEGENKTTTNFRRGETGVTFSHGDYFASIDNKISVLTLEDAEGAWAFNSAAGYLVKGGNATETFLRINSNSAKATISKDNLDVATIIYKVVKDGEEVDGNREVFLNINGGYPRYGAYAHSNLTEKDKKFNFAASYLYYREFLNEETLAEIEANGLDGTEYTVIDDLVVHHVKGNTAWAHDMAKSYAYRENTYDATWYGGYNADSYTQHNWVMLTFPEGTDMNNTVENRQLKNVKGTYHGHKGVSHEIVVSSFDNAAFERENSVRANTYNMASFWDDNTYDYVTVLGKNFFFMNPKIEEVCHITEAVWNGTGFVVPANQTVEEVHLNSGDLKGGVKVNWAYNDGGAPAEIGEDRYNFLAVVTKNASAHAAGGAGAPAKVAPSNCGLTDYVVYPLDFTVTSNIVTEVKDVDVAGREVKSVRFYDIAGRARSEAQPGINIVVTEYTDGTHSTAKMVR